MSNTIKLAIAILGMVLFASCTKKETTVINNYQLVKVTFNPSEFLSVDVSSLVK